VEMCKTKQQSSLNVKSSTWWDATITYLCDRPTVHGYPQETITECNSDFIKILGLNFGQYFLKR